MKAAAILLAFALTSFAQDTGVIAGTLVDDQNRPVEGRKVELRVAATQGAVASAATGEAGDFRFADLAPQIYTIAVLDARYRQGNSAIDNDEFRAYNVRPGETLNVRVSVFEPAIITGVVRDIYGEPIPNARVQVMRKTIQDRRVYLGAGASGNTDDRGIYRISGIRPGQSYVQVAARADPFSSLQTFYGNTTDLSRARPIAVTAGAQIDGIDILAAPVDTYAIRGRLLYKDGSPVIGDSLAIIPNDGSVGRGSAMAQTDRDGRFSLKVPPGPYVIAPGGSPILRFGSNPPPAPDIRGHLAITVANADVSFELIVSAGEDLTGTVQFEDGSSLPKSMNTTISLHSLEPTTLAPPSPTGAAVKPDGTFAFTKRFPGRYYLSSSSIGGESYIKSINGAPVDPAHPLFVDITMDGGNKLDLVLSSKTGALSGSLSAPGLVTAWPASDDDPGAWNPYAVHTGASKADGTFHLTGIAPGKYHIAAFDPGAREIDGLVFDPTFLRQFETQTLDVAEDSRATIELQIVPPGAIAEAAGRLP